MYRILNEQGKPIGVPIKASDFYFKPTLKFLEGKFKGNEIRKVSEKTRAKNAIDKVLLKDREISINELAMLLEKEGIHTVFRKSVEGQLYGITYIDHTTKNVFNGSSLGKQYSGKAIEERCGLKIAGEEKRNQIYEKLPSKESLIDNLQQQKETFTIPDLVKALDMLLQAEYSSDFMPNQLKNKRKKRKRKGLSN
ncbi:hypothetical protein D3C85_1235150 [compost metagenome]